MKKQLHFIVLLIACISISSVSFALPTWDAPVLKSSVLTSVLPTMFVTLV